MYEEIKEMTAKEAYEETCKNNPSMAEDALWQAKQVVYSEIQEAVRQGLFRVDIDVKKFAYGHGITEDTASDLCLYFRQLGFGADNKGPAGEKAKEIKIRWGKGVR